MGKQRQWPKFSWFRINLHEPSRFTCAFPYKCIFKTFKYLDKYARSTHNDYRSTMNKKIICGLTLGRWFQCGAEVIGYGNQAEMDNESWETTLAHLVRHWLWPLCTIPPSLKQVSAKAIFYGGITVSTTLRECCCVVYVKFVSLLMK